MGSITFFNYISEFQFQSICALEYKLTGRIHCGGTYDNVGIYYRWSIVIRLSLKRDEEINSKFLKLK